MSDAWLAHHGILGQKWGKMQGPPYPLDDDEHSAAERKDGWKKSLNGKNEKLYDRHEKKYSVDKEGAKKKLEETKKNLETAKDKNAAKREVKWAKEDLDNEKIKEKLNKKGVSKHQLKLQEHYKQQGMTDEEAAVAAYKRARTEKILLAAGALTVAGVTAYVVSKHLDKTVDKYLDSSVTLHNISNNSNKGVEDAFYAAFNKSDRLKYRGMYGDAIKKQGAVYDTSFKIKSGLKVASEKSASRVLSETMSKDAGFKKDVVSQIERLNASPKFGYNDKQIDVISKAAAAVKRGKLDDPNVAKAINFGLVDHSEQGERVSKAFYNALKKNGYDGLMDINDKSLSGYNAKAPVIIFNGKNKIDSMGSKKLSDTAIAQDKGKSEILNILQSQLKLNAPYMGIGAAAGAVGMYSQHKDQAARDQAVIDKYKKEHPGTKLTNTEILRNYQRGK